MQALACFSVDLHNFLAFQRETIKATRKGTNIVILIFTTVPTCDTHLQNKTLSHFATVSFCLKILLYKSMTYS